MKLPIRHENHIIESQSFKIFEEWIPDHWVVRQVTERDYGIDAYIEIVNNKRQLTGNLISIQLKGSASAINKKDIEGKIQQTYSGIKTETANYWFNTLTPVFLVVIDIGSSNLFFVPVKKQIRLNYKKFIKQKTISFTLKEKYSSIDSSWLTNLLLEYFFERDNVRLVEHTRNLLIHWQYYLGYLQEELGRDGFLPVEEPEVFIHIYKVLREMASLLMLKWEAAELKEIFDYDKKIENSFYNLHSFTMDKFIPDIEKMFFIIFNKTRDIVTNHESDYWMSKEFFMWRKAIEFTDEVTYENRYNLI